MYIVLKHVIYFLYFIEITKHKNNKTLIRSQGNERLEYKLKGAGFEACFKLPNSYAICCAVRLLGHMCKSDVEKVILVMENTVEL